MTSQYGDDKGTIPLYEQIYAIAGITPFYRITLNKDALADIKGESLPPLSDLPFSAYSILLDNLTVLYRLTCQF